MTRRDPGRDRGAVAVEFAVLVPVLVLLTGLVAGGARVWHARSAVDHVASAAARGASLAQSPGAAERDARRLAAIQAEQDGVRCHPLTVAVDARGLATPPGTPASASVIVTCDVPLADVLVPGWPGSLPLRATASSVIDPYRERQ